jgi:histidyl-tRNA synthetase
MINDYEIPTGCHLYFGASAARKREIENRCVSVLNNEGFDEIVTPIFSYHQTLKDPKKIISLSDVDNHKLSLRADSAQDVTRLISKRLGRSTEHKKWFYIQPVLTYPSTETNQIGAEWIGNGDISDCANITTTLLDNLDQRYTIQLGNINIPALVAKEANIALTYIEKHNIEVLSSRNIPWLNALIEVSSPFDLPKLFDIVPASIAIELKKLHEIAGKIDYKNIVVTPLYHASLEYYDDLFFRFISGNSQLAMGGSYATEEGRACGFALYTDTLI